MASVQDNATHDSSFLVLENLGILPDFLNIVDKLYFGTTMIDSPIVTVRSIGFDKVGKCPIDYLFLIFIQVCALLSNPRSGHHSNSSMRS